jgi:hypothetical protein
VQVQQLELCQRCDVGQLAGEAIAGHGQDLDIAESADVCGERTGQLIQLQVERRQARERKELRRN